MIKYLNLVTAVIIFFIKLTFVGELIIFILISLINIILNKRITRGIVVRRFGKMCAMKLKIIDILRIYRIDYFSSKIKITKYIIDFFFNNCFDKIKNREFEAETNSIIIRGLCNTYKDKIKITVLKTWNCWQPCEKLSLISPISLWKNIYKIQMYKTIFRKEKLSHIVIKIYN